MATNPETGDRTSGQVPLLPSLCVGALAGLLLAAGFPPYGAPVSLPAGIALLLIALHRVDLRGAAYTGFICGAVYLGGTLFWLANLFGAAAVSLVAIAAVFPTLFAVVYVLLRRRWPRWQILIAPVVWTAFEYYRSEPFALNFGWVGLGYGVIDTEFWSRLAPFFGSYGMSFCLVLLGAVATAIWEGKRRGRGIALTVLALLWGITLILPRSRDPITHPIQVRLVQALSDDTQELLTRSQPDTSKNVKPQIVVWPEYSLQSDPTRDPRMWARIQKVATGYPAYLLFGAKEIPDPANEDQFRNTAFLVDPEGKIVAKHVKNHLVHFIKDGIRGTDAKAFSTAIGRVGVGICFDMDYPVVARRLTEDGAEYLLIPNMDPAEWGAVQRSQHRLMFQMRAAECGRFLARADVAGGTSVCNSRGQVVASVGTEEPAVLDAPIDRRQGRNLYVLGGWRFGPFCLLLTVAGVLLSLAKSVIARGKVRTAKAIHP